ncbi:MAG: PD-(D/E)XK nuclease family protein [Rubripirellula sp.]
MIDRKLNWTADFCRQQLLTEKWLIAPNRRVGHQWKEWINRDRAQSTINLYIKTFRGIIVAAIGDKQGSETQIASDSVCDLLLQRVVQGLAGDLKYFSQQDSLSGVCSIIARTIRDLRMAGLTSGDIERAHFDSAEKAADLKLILSEYTHRLHELGLLDYTDCLQKLCGSDFDGNAMFNDVRMLLVQDADEFSALELQLIEQWAESGWLIRPEIAQTPKQRPRQEGKERGDRRFQFAVAVGEANEIQAAINHIVTADHSLDQVQLLHTDYATYVPLITEYFASVDQLEEYDIDRLPVTFAEGIASVYSRPGRALRAWLRWIDHDFPQVRLVQMLREGLLDLADDDAVHGYTRLASQFGKLPIGLGKARYLDVLDVGIAQAQQKVLAAAQDPEQASGQNPPNDYGVASLLTLRKTMQPLLARSPEREQGSLDVLAAAANFLHQHARKSNKLDRYAASAMLDKIDQMGAALHSSRHDQFDVWPWLLELPITCRIMSSGPAPGCLHVDHVSTGDPGGREHTILVGMDDTRYPVRSRQDPLLLDEERKRISIDLPTAAEKSVRLKHRFQELLASNRRQSITLVHSQYSLTQNCELFPSSALLEAYRVLSENSDATDHELALAAGEPVGFVNQNGVDLKSHPSYLRQILGQRDPAVRRSWVEDHFPIWRASRLAAESIADANHFTAFDGHVPAAGSSIDPTLPMASPVSSSGLENYAACPRRYFFQRALKVFPPNELKLDTERWLDPLQMGALMHSVFEKFLIQLTKQELTPDFARDRDLILETLHLQLADAETTMPVLNQDAKQRQIADLEKMCEIFLREEQRYCHDFNATPYVMEAAIGIDRDSATPLDSREPVAIALPDGRTCHVRGIIDRVDQISVGDGKLFAIWDYKTGSDWGFDQADPTASGRKLQPYLYAGMLQHRLRDVHGSNAKVERFGYFFPSSRANGLRIQWTTDLLKETETALAKMFDLIAQGCFVATDQQEDCKFCDYQGICGEASVVAANTKSMIASADLPLLNTFQSLRGKSDN